MNHYKQTKPTTDNKKLAERDKSKYKTSIPELGPAEPALAIVSRQLSRQWSPVEEKQLLIS